VTVGTATLVLTDLGLNLDNGGSTHTIWWS